MTKLRAPLLLIVQSFSRLTLHDLPYVDNAVFFIYDYVYSRFAGPMAVFGVSVKLLDMIGEQTGDEPNASCNMECQPSNP
jgi:hypothetical protein